MKKLAFTVTLAGSAAFADYTCNQTFYLQGATQIWRHGAGLNWASAPVVNDLSPDLAGLNFILQEMTYAVPLNFTPNMCVDTTSPARVDYWMKDSGATAFRRVNGINYPRFQLYDSLFTAVGFRPPRNLPYMEWFALNDSTRDLTAPLTGYMGIDTTRPGPRRTFEAWYGVSYLQDSTCAGVTCITNNRYTPYLFGPMDSLLLDSSLYIYFNWLNTLAQHNGTSRRVWMTVQTVKASYDTIVPAALRPPGASSRFSFSAWQQGRMVWIHAGKELAAQGASVELYDMFGRKTAVLRPQGGLYSWNGKNLGGGDASAGLYFARAGSRVLGKFVYGR
jgi:hypothetical protein